MWSDTYSLANYLLKLSNRDITNKVNWDLVPVPSFLTMNSHIPTWYLLTYVIDVLLLPVLMKQANTSYESKEVAVQMFFKIDVLKGNAQSIFLCNPQKSGAS